MGKFYSENGGQKKAEESYRAARDVIDGLKTGPQNSELLDSLENFPPVQHIDRLTKDASPSDEVWKN